MPADPSGDPTVFYGDAGRAGDPTGEADEFGDRYREPRLVARGGMGAILVAHDERLGRKVALKTLRPDLGGDPEFRARFEAEARTTSGLEHPNIVPIHDLALTPHGRPFFAMKLVRGRSLAEVLRGPDRPPTRRLLDAFLKICDAIAFAHDRGVVHRDLKPDNVMVGAFGEVLVMDWGLAVGAPAGTARAAGEAHRTAPGSVVGTPAYMSPEQAASDLEAVGEASDVYGLGAILYEVLTGTPPHRGSDPRAVLERVRRGELELPSERAPDRSIPRELEAVVLRAMARRPEDRYARVPDLRADLEAWLDGRALAAARYNPLQRAIKTLRRHPVATGAAAAALAAGLAVWTWLGWRDRLQRAGEIEAALDQARATASRPEELGARLGAVAALDRALRHAPTDPRLVASRRDAGEALARTALAQGDLALARRAYEELGRFDVPQHRVDAWLDEVETARHARRRERAGRLRAIVAEIRNAEGLPYVLEDLVLDASGYREPHEVEILVSECLEPAIERARREGGAGRWYGRERDLVLLACRVLGLAGGPVAIDALARWLEVAGDPGLRTEAVRALTRTRDVRALAPLEALRERLGDGSEEWFRLGPLLRRMPPPPPGDLPSSELHRIRGRTHFDQDREDAALADAERALQLDPGSGKALLLRAALRNGRNDMAGALEDLDRAILLAPDWAQPYADRAVLLLSLGRTREALDDLERAIEREPGVARHVFNRGVARGVLGDAAGAREDFDAAIRLDPRSPLPYVQRGLASMDAGDLGAALEDFDRAIDLDPGLSTARVRRGYIRLRLGDPVGALADADRSIQAEVGEARAYYLRGLALIDLREWTAAIEDLARAHDLDPDLWQAAYYRGLAAGELGRLEEARADLADALSRAPAAERPKIEAALRRAGGR